MRIERFWASGYRSLKDIDLTFSGPLDVFYGQNGAGKSNLLRAIRITLDLLSRRMQSTPLCDIRSGLGQRDGGRWVLYDFVRPDDLSRGAPPQIQLGLAIALDSHLTLGSPPTNPEFEALLRCSPLWGPQRRASSNGRSCFVG